MSQNRSAPAGGAKPMRRFSVGGAHALGKITSLIAKKDCFEIRVFPLAWMIVALWGTADVVLAVCYLLEVSLLISFPVALVCGLAAYLLVLYLYPGRLLRRLPYGEITSFVMEDPEMSLTTNSGGYISIRLSRKKQLRLLLGTAEMLRQNGEYHFERNGQYFRIKPGGETTETEIV